MCRRARKWTREQMQSRYFETVRDHRYVAQAWVHPVLCPPLLLHSFRNRRPKAIRISAGGFRVVDNAVGLAVLAAGVFGGDAAFGRNRLSKQTRRVSSV
jgi:hypothetical protein